MAAATSKRQRNLPHSRILTKQPCYMSLTSLTFCAFSLSLPPTAASDPALDELKELVARELKSNGILNQLQAQLRAHIYTTLATHSTTTTTTTNHTPHHLLPTPLPPAYHTSIEGSLILSMFQEYCHFHHLYNTLSVLQLETSQPKPAHPIDRAAIARSLHISSSSAAATHHSLAYELYLLSHTSRPSSPLVSPRSEPHPLPLSHHMSSPNKATQEDLTPPLALSPARPLHRLSDKEDDDTRRLREVETQLAAMRTGRSIAGGGGGGDSSGGGEEYSEDWTGVSLDGSGGMEDGVDVYASDEAVLDGEKWAKRYDYVEAVQQHAR